jgi:hypothetical protein
MLMNLDSSTNSKAPEDRRCYIACKPDYWLCNWWFVQSWYAHGFIVANKKETY